MNQVKQITLRGVVGMLYIVKFYDVDIDEVAEFEHQSKEHAEEIYNIYKGMEGIEQLELIAYQDGVYTVIK